MNEFLIGVAAAGSLAVGMFFLRLWRSTRDRFFAFFGCAFWVLALNWFLLIFGSPAEEHRHYFYLLRLAAFLLIIWAIADKNRSAKRAAP
jgi:peptidoglycan/LPS O-acetylase OafA/YrhL